MVDLAKIDTIFVENRQEIPKTNLQRYFGEKIGHKFGSLTLQYLLSESHLRYFGYCRIENWLKIG